MFSPSIPLASSHHCRVAGSALPIRARERNASFNLSTFDGRGGNQFLTFRGFAVESESRDCIKKITSIHYTRVYTSTVSNSDVHGDLQKRRLVANSCYLIFFFCECQHSALVMYDVVRMYCVVYSRVSLCITGGNLSPHPPSSDTRFREEDARGHETPALIREDRDSRQSRRDQPLETVFQFPESNARKGVLLYTCTRREKSHLGIYNRERRRT